MDEEQTKAEIGADCVHKKEKLNEKKQFYGHRSCESLRLGDRISRFVFLIKVVIIVR
jgi:hypothetical protein